MKTENFGRLASCRSCGGKKLTRFFDLGNHPLANSLLAKESQKENRYPLALFFCKDCHLVQLDYTVNPKILFNHYVWVTGTSAHAKSFAETFADELIKKCPQNQNKIVIEIASNDGTFLKPFINRGFNVLGIDPAKNIAAMANSDGVPTEAVFFGQKTAEKILKKTGPAPAIFARNVLAHVANPRDFLKGVHTLLAENGVVAIEPHYARKIIEGLQYDSIYHEHLCYFTLETLSRLLESEKLHVFDVGKSPISGGAIIVYASKNRRPATKTLLRWRTDEKKNKVNTLDTWVKFAKAAANHKKIFTKLLCELKETDGNIVGYGASARSSTLLNFCNIDKTIISEIADGNPLKHNLFTAGTKIPIKNPAEVFGAGKPSGVVILGWNFADEILSILKSKFAYTGKCIIPLPNKPTIIRAGFKINQ